MAKHTQVLPEVHGPFELPFRRNDKGAKHISADPDGSFWEKVGPELANGKGCYAMGVRTAHDTFVPFYAGKAGVSFSQELFAPDKLNKFNKAVFLAPRGTPVVALLLVPESRWSSKLIREIERALIRLAASINPDLINKYLTNGEEEVERAAKPGAKTVKPTVSIAALRRMLGW